MLAVVLAAVTVAAGCAGVATAATGVFNSSPGSGAPGSVITAWYGSVCVPPSAGATVTVALVSSGGSAVAQASAPVYPGGQWTVSLIVPPSAPAGSYVVSAECSTPAGAYFTYAPNSFTVPGPTSTSTTSTSSTTTSSTSTTSSTTTSSTSTTSSTTTTLPSSGGGLVPVSTDPFTNPSSQHQTQVEPDTFANGNTIVSAFQSGRFFDGGSSDIGWARSIDGGTTWTNGFLPSLTAQSSPPGPYERASDPSVTYDVRHQMWLITALAMVGPRGAAVTVSRSSDGLAWSAPIVVASTAGYYDKDWVVCDGHPSSPFYGNCYVTFDDEGVGDRLLNTTSADGGLTWSAPAGTADNSYGLGGQPLVQPGGTVVVPVANASVSLIGAYRSSDGGQTWSAVTFVSPIYRHAVAGSLRALPLPSAEIDGAGRVFVVWSDCRFRARCASNDIVMSTSADGVTWTPTARIPIDDVGGTVDHFVPGVAVDPTTSGPTARLSVVYYYYPNATCTVSTCQLNVGAISSGNGGASWGNASRLTPTSMSVPWLATTNQGYMVGDYISASFAGGKATAVFAVASAPDASLHEAMFARTLP